VADRLKLLDLFCGAGGAAMGYYHAGFDEIVGVDIKPQPHYPFTFIQANAMTFPLEGFDAIHASPPCQAYIQRNKNLLTKYPRMIDPIREKLEICGAPYVIENVPGAPLIRPTILCGTGFKLSVIRHRLFETSFPLPKPPACDHWGSVSEGDFAGVYARGGKGPRRGAGNRDRKPTRIGPDPAYAMDIDWMNGYDLTQAIPPAYTQWIGERFLQYIKWL